MVTCTDVSFVCAPKGDQTGAYELLCYPAERDKVRPPMLMLNENRSFLITLDVKNEKYLWQWRLEETFKCKAWMEMQAHLCACVHSRKGYDGVGPLLYFCLKNDTFHLYVFCTWHSLSHLTILNALQVNCTEIPSLGPNIFVLQFPSNTNFVLECGSPEEKNYWMDIIRKRQGFQPTSMLPTLAAQAQAAATNKWLRNRLRYAHAAEHLWECRETIEDKRVGVVARREDVCRTWILSWKTGFP